MKKNTILEEIFSGLCKASAITIAIMMLMMMMVIITVTIIILTYLLHKTRGIS